MIVKAIDTDACSKCGECARICANSKVIEMGGDGYPRFERELQCIHCGHCLAICPSGAITFEFRGEDPSGDFVVGPRDLGPVSTGPEYLLQALDSTRSCRFFDGRPVEDGKLERVLETMIRSPSAGNEQNRNFYVFGDKLKVGGLDADTAAYYRKLNASDVESARPLARRERLRRQGFQPYLDSRKGDPEPAEGATERGCEAALREPKLGIREGGQALFL